jgi:hypothetical protein
MLALCILWGLGYQKHGNVSRDGLENSVIEHSKLLALQRVNMLNGDFEESLSIVGLFARFQRDPITQRSLKAGNKSLRILIVDERLIEDIDRPSLLQSEAYERLPLLSSQKKAIKNGNKNSDSVCLSCLQFYDFVHADHSYKVALPNANIYQLQSASVRSTIRTSAVHGPSRTTKSGME